MLANKERFTELDVIKGIAILSIYSAHCNGVDSSNVLIRLMSLILQHFGTFGVGCFFIVAGILYRKKEMTDKVHYLFSKIDKIIFPWIISSIAIYLYVHLRKPPISLMNWFQFFIGNGSYLYYLTILFILYVIYLFPKMYNTKINIFLIFINIISICFFWNGYLDNPYLNVFNWIGYFSLGIIIQENYCLFLKFIKRFIKFRYYFYIVNIALILVMSLKNIEGSYWGSLHVITSYTGIFCIFLYSYTHNNYKLSNIGKESLFFYLWHMPFAAIVTRFFNIGLLSVFVFIRPFIVCLIMCLFRKVIINLFDLKIKKLLGLNYRE